MLLTSQNNNTSSNVDVHYYLHLLSNGVTTKKVVDTWSERHALHIFQVE